MEFDSVPDRESVYGSVSRYLYSCCKTGIKIALVIVFVKSLINIEDDLLVPCSNHCVRIEDARFLCDAYDCEVICISILFAASR